MGHFHRNYGRALRPLRPASRFRPSAVVVLILAHSVAGRFPIPSAISAAVARMFNARCDTLQSAVERKRVGNPTNAAFVSDSSRAWPAA
jgi:hypothetical protein